MVWVLLHSAALHRAAVCSMECAGLESSFFAVRNLDAERKRRRANGSESSEGGVPAPPATSKVPKPRSRPAPRDRVAGGKPGEEGSLAFKTLEHFSSKGGRGPGHERTDVAPPRAKSAAAKGRSRDKGGSSSSSSSSKDAAPAKEVASSVGGARDPFALLKERDLAVWAKMGSFPPWPARFCSGPEVVRLEKSSKLRKGHQAVVFLGLTRSMAWVPDSGVSEFTAQSFARAFSAKFFQKERDYQASIVEAVRRTRMWYSAREGDGEADKAAFDPEVLSLVRGTAFEWERDDCCYVCFGTELSGVAVVCEHTSGASEELDCSNECHLQCLAQPVAEAPVDMPWLCDYHCDMHGLPKGVFQAPRKRTSAQEEDLEEEEEEGGPVGRKSKKRQSNNDLGLSNGIVSLARRASREGVAAAPQPPEEETEDTCYVCREGGRLILCDFAHCPKTYHHSCVLKTSPLLVDSCNSSGGGACVSVDGCDDLWFCPRHTCARCSAVQQTKHPLHAADVPRYLLLSRLQGDGGLVEQKQLTQCDGCPLSLCRMCETELSSEHGDGKQGRAVVFKSRKTLLGDKSCMCVCCYSVPESGDTARTDSGHALRLARLLEAALSRVLTSRLALPFLHPLLPGVYAPSMQAELERRLAQQVPGVGLANAKLVSFLDTQPSTPSRSGPQHLLESMENIRALKYSSAEEFFADLQLLRARAACILGMDSGSKSTLLLDALDTVLSDVHLFVGSRERSLLTAQGAVGDGNAELVRALFRLSCEGSAAARPAANITVQSRR